MRGGKLLRARPISVAIMEKASAAEPSSTNPSDPFDKATRARQASGPTISTTAPSSSPARLTIVPAQEANGQGTQCPRGADLRVPRVLLVSVTRSRSTFSFFRLLRYVVSMQKKPEEAAPEPVDDAALDGPIGSIVCLLQDHTEVSPGALLASLLVYFAAIAGEGSVLYQGGEQTAKLFAAIVGPTSMACKAQPSILPGSHEPLRAGRGEQALHRRGGIGGLPRHPQPGRPAEGQGRQPKAGLQARPAGAHQRARVQPLPSRHELEGSTCSANLCKAWDGKTLEHTTMRGTIKAHTHHVCAIVAITREVLRKELTDEDAQSGFSNRFLCGFGRPCPTVGTPSPTTCLQLSKEGH